MKILLIVIIYLVNCELGFANSKESIDQIILSAERLLNEELIIDASLLYEQALITNSSDQLPKILSRLAQCYIELKEHQKLISLLVEYNKFFHVDALIAYASSIPNYTLKDELYQKLLKIKENETPEYFHILFSSGLNHYTKGLETKKNGINSDQLFDRAANSFEQVINQVKLQSFNNDTLAFEAMKYQALAYYNHSNISKKFHALMILKNLTNLNPSEEVYYLTALLANELFLANEQVKETEVEELLVKGLSVVDDSSKKELLLKTLIKLTIQNQDWPQAEKHFIDYFENYASSFDCGEMYYWRAQVAKELKLEDKRKTYLEEVFLKHPKCTLAPEAYFQYYTFRDYMMGERSAIKHLHAMKKLFLEHPLLTTCHYLIGLDHKKDRFSLTGKIQKHKDLIAAIDAFQEAELIFDHLYENQLISSDKLPYYTQIRYRANLERALTNFLIARASEGSKKMIYLEYAQESFENLIKEFKNHSSSAAILSKDIAYHPLLQESELYLAEVYLSLNKEIEAEQLLNNCLNIYRNLKIEKNYFLTKILSKLGEIYQNKAQFEIALNHFQQAEQAYKDLSTEEKLNLWISQSDCYKGLGKFDDAMRILSRVVNDESVSSLRLKAMFLRAEIYEKLEKPEFAQKQLEALEKKGGEWSNKAKDKLVNYR